MSKEQDHQKDDKALHIAGVSGSYSPTTEEVQNMYNYLRMYFHRSQINGLVDIDTHERVEIKKMLRLPDNYR